MPNTPRMEWPFPSQEQDPWFDAFDGFVNQMDASVFASRDDRNLIFGGGGSFTFDADANLLSWDATLEVISAISGFRLELSAGSVTLEDGGFFYLDVVRLPTQNVVLSAHTGTQVPSTDTALVFAVRRGDTVYFRHGFKLEDGTSGNLFEVGSPKVNVIYLAGRESHDSAATPKKVGAIAFNPSDYAPVGTVVFRAIAGNGNVGLTNTVELYNLTDGETVATLEFTSTNTTKDEATLTLGSGVGEVDSTEHIYEVRLLLGAAPVDPDDTIELYSAELRIL